MTKRKNADRLLDQRGLTWWFKRDIPEACRLALKDPRTGQQRATYLVNLRTSDKREARRLRDELEAETSIMFAQIREGKTVEAETLTARELGRLHREAIAAVEHLGPEGPEDAGLSPLDAALASTESTLEALGSEEEQEAFLDALHGRELPGALVETFLSRADYAPKTLTERRSNLGCFVRWAEAQRPALTLDRIGRREAGRYVTEVLEEKHPATQKKHFSALRGYWSWLAARGHVELPQGVSREEGWPWSGQVTPRRGKRVERGSRSEEERPFTEEEVKALLFAPAPSSRVPGNDELIRDVLRVSLLSGMRLAEVLTLWVEEVREGPEGAGLVFDIQQGKTEAAARPVPVHPDLMGIIERRRKDKAPTAWLFHELAHDTRPADTFGKRFRRFREALGVEDKRDGKRRSLVNFHSARRWFTTQARHAGIARETIADVIGHVPDKKDLTFGVYTKGASPAQLRACVEAVKLPAAEAGHGV